jgi:hypothetical protein
MGQQLIEGGFANRPLEVRRTWLGSFRLHQDGRPAESVRRRVYRVTTDDGEEVEAELVPQLLGTDVPVIRVGTTDHRLVPRLNGVAVALACFPLVLLVLGAALGGLIGAVAAVVNIAVMRLERPAWARALVAVGVTVTAFFLWLALASLLLGSG